MNGEEVSFCIVNPAYIDDCCIEAGYYLNRAAKESYGRYTIFDIRNEIISGKQQLWILFYGDNEMMMAATTMICFYPRKTTLCVMFLGSNDDTLWAKYRELVVGKFESFAKDNGCDGIECTGREGWARVLEPFGWKKSFTVLEKNFNDPEG